MVGKDTNILGQLANIGSSKLEANRCQYLEQDVWTVWKQGSSSFCSLPGEIGNFLPPLNFVGYLIQFKHTAAVFGRVSELIWGVWNMDTIRAVPEAFLEGVPYVKRQLWCSESAERLGSPSGVLVQRD